MNYKSEKLEEDFSEIDLIKKYIKYFKLNIDNNEDESKPIIKNIKFKNEEIENAFLQQYESYILNLIESDQKLQEVLNINDGEFFEKLIIIDNITEKIKDDNNNNFNFIKIEVNSLFGLNFNNKNFDFLKNSGKNIIFTQKSKTAEIFDFAILINHNNQLILKLYQVSTKKSKEDLAKLDEDIIGLHCINISKNLEKLGKIKQFSFGIITSYKCYEKKKKDYNLMKDDCKRKNFEFFVYNLIQKQFYVEREDNGKTLLSLDNIYSIKDKNILNLPNYDSFFGLKPKLLTMKYVNQNYIHCIEKYLNENKGCDDVKIIGKIRYDKTFINASIKDKNLGLLISGNIIEDTNDIEKNVITEKQTNVSKNESNYNNMPKIKKYDIKIIKENGKNKIYKKETFCEKIEQINEIKTKISSPHILLFKVKENFLLGNKRNPLSLFTDEIINNKKKKY